MKLIALAAALTMGTAAIAQDMPQSPPPPPTGTESPTGDPAAPPPTDSMATPQTAPAPDPSMPTQPDPAMPTQGDPAMPAPAPAPGTPDPMTTGQPAPAPMAPGMAPGGAQVQFAPATQTPPPPAAKDYPLCSRTVTDSCRQRGG